MFQPQSLEHRLGLLVIPNPLGLFHWTSLKGQSGWTFVLWQHLQSSVSSGLFFIQLLIYKKESLSFHTFSLVLLSPRACTTSRLRPLFSVLRTASEKRQSHKVIQLYILCNIITACVCITLTVTHTVEHRGTLHSFFHTGVRVGLLSFLCIYVTKLTLVHSHCRKSFYSGIGSFFFY